MAELVPGTILKSRYKILNQLGHGGMGAVYLAEDQSLATQVAVKANHNLDPHASAQFIREARLLASLKHPNLPRVIDYFTEEDSQYLVMDYIPGNDLRALVEKKNPISTQLILKWAEQLGNAISYLHNQNPPIFHRDVKPANIKLTPSGEVVLVDFGIAKTGDPSQETQTGAWAFSPGFAPPEQVSGLRTGPYSDQFSLAATIYYLFAGNPPADSAQRMMGSVELVPLKSINPKIPDHVSNAVEKALSIKPEARFSTVSDFVGAITNTHPIPDPASMQRTVVQASRQGIPPTPPVGSSIPQKKSSPLGWIIGIIAVLALGIGGFFTLKTLGIIGTSPTATEAPTQQPEVVIPQSTEKPTEQVTPQVTAEQAVTATTAPSFTPVGRSGKIAFISNRQADGYNQVWLMDVVQDESGNLVGINPAQLTFTEGDKSKPSFSPDGTKVIYSGWSTEFSGNGTPYADDIWVIDITVPESQPVDISQRARNDWYAAWSPLGDKIVFTSYYRDDGIPMLFLMNPDGSEQERITDRFSEAYPSWTPQADFILYVQTTGELEVLYTRDKYSLFKTDALFDRSSNEGRLGHVAEPNISRDGMMIVYTAKGSTKTNIYTAVYADRGKTVTRLTDTGMDSSPFWSPDGKWITFTSKRDGNQEIYIMDATGGHVTNLTNLASSDFDAAWQPVALPK